MTIPSFMAFMVFMFVFSVVIVLICAWFVSDFVFKRLYLKDLEQRLAVILEKHGIEVQEEDYHSKFIACNPSIKEIISMLEAVYGIDDKALDKDFSAFRNSCKILYRHKHTPTTHKLQPIAKRILWINLVFLSTYVKLFLRLSVNLASFARNIISKPNAHSVRILYNKYAPSPLKTQAMRTA